jgi:hypothetical protein
VPPLADGNSARDVALAEFNALRAEINNRMTTTAALVGVGLTALGVIVSLVVKEDGDERLLLTVPPLAIAVNFLWAVENRQVGLIGRYIRTRLWPYLREGDDRLPSWEEDCAERRHGLVNVLRSIGTDFALTLVFVVAAASSLVVLGDSVQVDGQEKKVNLGLIVFDWILTVLALAVPIAMTMGNSLRASE